MSGFSRFYPDFTAGQLRYLAGGTNSALNDQYLLCDGSTVSQATYSDLYALIGLIKNGNWDTTTWTTQSSGTALSFETVIYNGSNLFVAAGGSGVLKTSTDAITWTTQTSGTTNQINALAYNGSNLYVYAGNAGTLKTSTDAITWTTRTSGTGGANSILSLIYNGSNLYVYGATSGGLKTSTDAITWDSRTSGTSSAIWALTYNGSNLYVYGGINGALATSTNAVTWTTRTGLGTDDIYSLMYHDGVYLAGGSGFLATSTDAITWTYQSAGIVSPTIIYDLEYTNGLYTGVCSNGAVIYSEDAITWTSYDIGSQLNSLAYKSDNLLVAVGNNGTIQTANFYTYDPTTQFALPTSAVAPSVKYVNTPAVYIKYK